MPNYLFQTIADHIAQNIADGTLTIGSKLPSERSMAENYGVSRNVIREAIRVLSEKGFIEVRAGCGGFVCKPDQQALSDSLTTVVESSAAFYEEIAEARDVFEQAIVSYAARKADRQDVAQLWALFDRMEQSKSNGKAFAALDREFHTALAACTKNSVITLLAGSIYNMSDSSLFLLTPLSPARMQSAQQEHRNMIIGIEHKDPTLAAEALRRHIACIREQLTTDR